MRAEVRNLWQAGRDQRVLIAANLTDAGTQRSVD